MGRGHPGVILGAVEAALRQRGLDRLYGAACALYGVLSVALGLTVWCDGRAIMWQQDGDEVSWPAGDPEGAAKRLAALAGHG
jgi:hypothetical protein